MVKVPRRYTTMQLLRFPLMFGGVLGAYWLMYSQRLTLFGGDLEAARQKNMLEQPDKERVLEKMRRDANTGIMEKRNKGGT